MIVLFTSNSNGNKQALLDPPEYVLFNAMKLQQDVKFFPVTPWNSGCLQNDEIDKLSKIITPVGF